MKNRCRAAWLGGLLLVCVGGSEPYAQSQWLTGYLQTVPLWTASTQFAESNLTNFSRFRLTSEPVFDDAKVSFNIAYEHVATLSVRPLTEAGESALRVEWHDVDADALRRALPGRVPSQFDAAMSGDVDIAWTRFAPTSVTMRGRSRTIGGGGTGEMELVAHDGLWQVDLDQPLTSAARVTGVIEGRARADGWAEVELDGALHLTCTDLGRCREVLAPAASSADTDLLTGSLAAEVRVNGTLGRPRLTGSVAVADVGVGALSGIQLEANVSADLTTLDVASAVGRLGNNVIRGRVRVVWDGGLIDGAIDGELHDLELLTPMLPAEWAPRGTVRVAAAIAGSVSSPSFDRITLTGNQLVLTPLFAGTPDEIPIAGRVNLEFEGSGPVAAPVGTTTLEATDLAWNNYRLGTARATIAVDGGTVHGQAELPEFSAVAEIALDLADRRTVDLIVDVADADLARVAADTAVPLAGTASLGAHVTYAFGESVGSAAAERVTVDIQLRSIEGSVGDTPVRLVQPADLRYLPTDISTDHVELTVGGTRVTLSGRLADGRPDILTARALGRVQDLTPLLTQIPGVAEWTGELDLAGTFQLEVVVAGSPSAPLLSGDLSLDNGRVGFGDHPPVDLLTLQAVYRDGVVRLEQLSGSWQRASLFATGVLPASLFADHLPPLIADVLPAGGPATLQAEINGITSAALVGYVEESTRMQLEGEMRATVDIQADDARLDAIRGALTLPEAAVTIAGIPLAQRRETRVELADGRVRIATFDWGNDDDYVTLGGTVSVGDDAVADLTVTAEIDLRALSAFLPAAVEGNALLIANIAGPIATPEITGSMELTDAGIRIADPRVAITNLSGALFLNDGVVMIHDMSGEANGGGLVVGGVLQLEGFRPHGTVTLAGRRIAMDVPTGLRTEVDADLGLTFEVDDIVLAGTATIQRGAYRKPITLAGGVLGALERSQSVRTVGLGQTGALDAVQLDLRITTTEDIRLDNNYLDAALGADVRVGGTIGAPAPYGAHRARGRGTDPIRQPRIRDRGRLGRPGRPNGYRSTTGHSSEDPSIRLRHYPVRERRPRRVRHQSRIEPVPAGKRHRLGAAHRADHERVGCWREPRSSQPGAGAGRNSWAPQGATSASTSGWERRWRAEGRSGSIPSWLRAISIRPRG